MKITYLSSIRHGQDGAIWGDLLFRFNARGVCYVHNIKEPQSINPTTGKLDTFATFTLDRASEIVPHSNAVMFGNEYYCEGDEFPLLYSNVYNNCAKEEDQNKGVCCVYRLQRNGCTFSTTLVQLIEIGFTENTALWATAGEQPDVRPYGNFTIDRERSIYYAFTMRDATRTTRYFSFVLPKAQDGITDARLGIKKVTLDTTDIIGYFDCPYHQFMQGACCHDGKIYSVEGFSDSKRPAVLRVVDPTAQRQELCVNLAQLGLDIEPEFIDFHGDTCYYSDAHGRLYRFEF